MTRKQRFLSKIHILLAKSRRITNLAIKIRNQCNQVIFRRYSIKDMSPYLNGEYLLLDHALPFCDTYFDIGANKGDWSKYLVDKAKSDRCKFYLYEPGIAAFNILSNRFTDYKNVFINKLAISDYVGKLEFYEQEDAGELSSAVKNWANGEITIIEVDTTTVDSELSRLKIDYLDYLKIDTEGFDLKVLRGALNSISGRKFGFIQFEYNTVWANSGSTLLEAYNILEANDYKIFLLQPDGLYSYDVRENGEFYSFSNFIAVSPANLIHLKNIIKGAA